MGLLMVEALLALEGCRCVSLGVQTPILDIAMATKSQDVDIVVLSFSANSNPGVMAEGLAELRRKLSPAVALWVGGRCPALARRAPAGVRVTAELQDLEEALADWRAASAT